MTVREKARIMQALEPARFCILYMYKFVVFQFASSSEGRHITYMTLGVGAQHFNIHV